MTDSETAQKALPILNGLVRTPRASSFLTYFCMRQLSVPGHENLVARAQPIPLAANLQMVLPP
jgi:hypothetical protein